MQKKLRFGIFGGGRTGHMIGHVYDAGCEVVALCDQRLSLLALRKEMFP